MEDDGVGDDYKKKNGIRRIDQDFEMIYSFY